MSYPEDVLVAAHRHCADHRPEVEASSLCRCFYCLDTFPPQAVERWLNEGSGTAVCPSCQIDSVIGDRSGYPVGRDDFATAMHKHWFERSYPLTTDPDVLSVHEQPEALEAETVDGLHHHFTLEQIASIERGLADIAAGRTYSHEEVITELRSKYGW